MNLDKLQNILSEEPAYRLKQAKEAVYKKLVDNWQEASALGKDLRDRLNCACPLMITAKVAASHDSMTEKAAITLADGLKIETVLLKHRDSRRTVCVSSQAGCPLACRICATGKMGFKRNLTSEEIIEQVIFWARRLKPAGERPACAGRVDNVVFMGMGEPFLNYDSVLTAIKIMNDPDGLCIGARHITVSTIGLPDGIRKLAREKLQINLAVSLHAPSNVLRSRLIPANRTYPIKMIIPAVGEYMKKTKRRVCFEYVMLREVNDSPALARHLAELLAGLPPELYFVNLILYNAAMGFYPSRADKIMEFKKVLAAHHITVTERYRFGRDISAACGQLAGG